MERIILDVNDQTAKAWRNTSAKLRKQIGKNLELVLNDSLNRSKETNFDLLLQELSAEAARNGLTEEVLSQLLNDND